MNKHLAFKISKHPMIKKLLESTDQKDIARLIVEELMNEDEDTLKTAKETIDNNFADHGEKTDDGNVFNGISDSTRILKNYKNGNSLTQEEKEELENYLEKKIEELKNKIRKFAQKIQKTENLNTAFEAFLGKERVQIVSITFSEASGAKTSESSGINYDIKVKQNEEEVEFTGPADVLYAEISKSKTFNDGDLTLKAKEGGSKSPEDSEAQAAQEPSDDGFEVNEANQKNLLAAIDALLNDFYTKKYKIQQAKILEALINVLAEIAKDNQKEVAYGKVTPDREGATTTEAKETKQKPETVKSLRVNFKQFLFLLNKTKRALTAFHAAAAKGSVLTSNMKQKFMGLLKELQESIAKLNANIGKFKKQNITEETKEEKDARAEELVKKWEEVQEAYNEAQKAAVAVKEVIEGGELQAVDENLINNAYTTAINLSQHFPSVNPFNKGAKTKEDMYDYKNKFDAAIADVKSALQIVLTITKGENVTSDAYDGAASELNRFSETINEIFQVSKIDLKQPAVEKKPPSKSEPPAPEETDAEEDQPNDMQQAENAITNFINSLMKKGLIKNPESSVEESLQEDVVLTTLGVALAGVFAEIARRVMKDKNRAGTDYEVSEIFIRSLITFFKEKEMLGHPNAGDYIKREWNNSTEKDKIIKVYKGSLIKKPKLVGKRVQDIVTTAIQNYSSEDTGIPDVKVEEATDTVVAAARDEKRKDPGASDKAVARKVNKKATEDPKLNAAVATVSEEPEVAIDSAPASDREVLNDLIREMGDKEELYYYNDNTKNKTKSPENLKTVADIKKEIERTRRDLPTVEHWIYVPDVNEFKALPNSFHDETDHFTDLFTSKPTTKEEPPLTLPKEEDRRKAIQEKNKEIAESAGITDQNQIFAGSFFLVSLMNKIYDDSEKLEENKENKLDKVKEKTGKGLYNFMLNKMGDPKVNNWRSFTRYLSSLDKANKLDDFLSFLDRLLKGAPVDPGQKMKDLGIYFLHYFQIKEQLDKIIEKDQYIGKDKKFKNKVLSKILDYCSEIAKTNKEFSKTSSESFMEVAKKFLEKIESILIRSKEKRQKLYYAEKRFRNNSYPIDNEAEYKKADEKKIPILKQQIADNYPELESLDFKDFDFIEKYNSKLKSTSESIEEQIANKIKPLIKETLRRNK
jgi:hypothetical protein